MHIIEMKSEGGEWATVAATRRGAEAAQALVASLLENNLGNDQFRARSRSGGSALDVAEGRRGVQVNQRIARAGQLASNAARLVAEGRLLSASSALNAVFQTVFLDGDRTEAAVDRMDDAASLVEVLLAEQADNAATAVA